MGRIVDYKDEKPEKEFNLRESLYKEPVILDRVVCSIKHLAKNKVKHSDFDDFVQETTLHILNCADKYNPQLSPLNPWLATVINHKITDYVRAQYRQKTTSMETIEDPEVRSKAWIDNRQRNPFEKLQEKLEEEREKVLAKLRPQTKRYLELIARGFKWEQIAQQEGTPLGTVKSRFYRIKRELEKLVV